MMLTSADNTSYAVIAVDDRYTVRGLGINNRFDSHKRKPGSKHLTADVKVKMTGLQDDTVNLQRR